MLADDLTVEVRDITLARQGIILPRDLDLTSRVVHCGVGEWTLTLPAEHPLTPVLRTPGAGLIVTGPDDVLWSGPVTTPTLDAGTDDPAGLVTITGVTDDVLAADATAWPQPANGNVATQAAGYDNRSGPAETVMRAYVAANIGPTAPVSRRGLLAQRLTLAPDLGRGTNVVKSARFPVLGELLTEIATVAGLGWRIVQRDDVLVFEVYEIADRTATVRLDVANGGLESQSAATSPPAVTHVLVAGQGQGEARTLLERSTPESVAAAAAWGRRIERFKDQRQTDDLTELQQAGDEDLADGGFTATNVAAVPAEILGMQYARDWREGDHVTVVLDGQETTSTVTAATLRASAAGVLVGADIGDVTGFDPNVALSGRVEDTARRVSQLERVAEAKNVFDAAAITTGRLAWARLPLPAALGTGVDLDSITTPGDYTQSSNPAAAGGTNYPAPYAGLLEVAANANGSIVYQRYTVYRGGSGLTYTRSWSSNVWGPWVKAGDQPFAQAAGRNAVAASGITTITFPAGRFTVTPVVTAVVLSTTGDQVSVVFTSAPSATSFEARLFTIVGASRIAGAIAWTAVQMTPTSAIG
ncbi:Gp37-like protein [Cellulosimicrobium sp. CpK407]|uniref:Gp37-like protein n=1 Tax=Cellulosimicrobium sp. CpK407 TaxID=3229847 RepID=UPI003F2A4FB4